MALRLWPGVALAALVLATRFGVPRLAPELIPTMIGIAFAGVLGILLWWIFWSRASGVERWGVPVAFAAALVAAQRVLDPSIAKGMMGMMFPLYAVPIAGAALVGWAVLGGRLTGWARRASLAAAALGTAAVWPLLRTEGVSGNLSSEFRARWSTAPEYRLPLDAVAAPAAGRADSVQAEWPGFRGPRRDGTAPGVRIAAANWAVAPPSVLWRRKVGPGWSSFAVRGDLLYTQEQRGDHEVVACYRLSTGEPVWQHSDKARFWESNGGAGPRATPSVHDAVIYSTGATGILNALDADTGAVRWSRDLPGDLGAKVPYWGISASPLVVGDLVIVAVSGQMVAYGLDGVRRWTASKVGTSYSSPQAMMLDGAPQVVLSTEEGVTSLNPADGSRLWHHSWSASTILQPALADGDVLVAGGGDAAGSGIRRFSVKGGTATPRWTSTGLKPYFNDFVVHKAHAYGFDGRILACIELAEGRRAWKGGRYGNGQLILLPDQDLLVVVSEEGGLALVEAAPTGFNELARIPALDGKTWNHPAVARGVLLARNGEEMVALRVAR
jgi:outer membrane protein assembly factor BamB